MEKPYSCSECSASFCRKYNLTRHQEMFHENNSADEEDDSFFKSDNENDSETEYDSEVDNESENMSVNSEPDNDEESFAESDEEDEDVFHDQIHDAITYNHDKLQPLVESYQENGLSLRQAVHKAFEELRPRYEKTLKKVFVKYITDMFAKQRHPLFQSILKRKKVFESDGLNEDEAIRSAVSYRKYSVYDLLSSFPRDDTTTSEQKDEGDESY